MTTENLYLIKISNKNECFYKIGLTVHRFCRFYEIIKHGYSVEIIYMIFKIECNSAMKLENELITNYSAFKYNPNIKFGGHTECFYKIEINEYIKRVSSYSINKEITKNLKISWR